MQQALCKYSGSPVLEGLELFEECRGAAQLKWEGWSLAVESSQVHGWAL